MKLNVANNTWQQFKMDEAKATHACIFFNNKVIVAGGSDGSSYSNSTLIIDVGVDDLKIRQAGDMNKKRWNLGLGILSILEVPTVVAFGGSDAYYNGFHDSVEIWNDTSETWELSTNLTLGVPKVQIGFATVATKLVCPDTMNDN